MHVEMASKLGAAIDAGHLTDVGALEQALVYGDAGSKELIALLTGPHATALLPADKASLSSECLLHTTKNSAEAKGLCNDSTLMPCSSGCSSPMRLPIRSTWTQQSRSSGRSCQSCRSATWRRSAILRWDLARSRSRVYARNAIVGRKANARRPVSCTCRLTLHADVGSASSAACKIRRVLWRQRQKAEAANPQGLLAFRLSVHQPNQIEQVAVVPKPSTACYTHCSSNTHQLTCRQVDRAVHHALVAGAGA